MHVVIYRFMKWQDFELTFNRALRFSFSRKKLLFTFPALVLCGLIAVIFRTLAIPAGTWALFSFAFIPLFLCAAVLLSLGIILVRLYHDEVKGLPSSLRKTVQGSSELIVNAVYFALPFILTYLVLWIFLGLFYLFKAIPIVGAFIKVVFSFGPFLIVLGSLSLGLLNILFLFFATPAIALKSSITPKIAEEALHLCRRSPFNSVALFLFGLLPLLCVVLLLILAVVLTDIFYLQKGSSLSTPFEWLFIMVPFSALLTPAVIFFFNFAAESFAWMQRRETS